MKQRLFNPEDFSSQLQTPEKNSEENTTIGMTLRFPKDIYAGLRLFAFKENKKINPFIISLLRDFLKEKGCL